MSILSVKKLRLELSTARIEALTDGVFAIAMTLLVLNFDIPNHIEGNGALDLHRTLGDLWPDFLHYVESFLILAIFWIKNHQQFHFVKKSDHNLLWLSLTGLLFVCLIPFTTSLVSDYGDVPLAAIVFEVNLLAAGSVYYLLWCYVTKGKRLVDSSLDDRIVTVYKRSSLVIPAVSLAAIALSIFHPRWGTSLYFTIPFILIYLRRG